MVERLLALAVLAASGVYLATAWPLPRGTAAGPGPGFFPLAVGAFGAAVALIWMTSAFRRAPAAGGGVITAPEGRRRVVATGALLVGFCLGLPWTGYPVVAFLFVGLLLRGLGAGWRAALAIGLLSAAISHYLFGVVLGVPLPRGIWFD